MGLDPERVRRVGVLAAPERQNRREVADGIFDATVAPRRLGAVEMLFELPHVDSEPRVVDERDPRRSGVHEERCCAPWSVRFQHVQEVVEHSRRRRRRRARPAPSSRRRFPRHARVGFPIRGAAIRAALPRRVSMPRRRGPAKEASRGGPEPLRDHPDGSRRRPPQGRPCPRCQPTGVPVRARGLPS